MLSGLFWLSLFPWWLFIGTSDMSYHPVSYLQLHVELSTWWPKSQTTVTIWHIFLQSFLKMHFHVFSICISISSVQFSCWVLSDSLWPHEPQHARPPCPSPTPGVHSDSRPLSQWCHPAISSSVVPFSSCPQSLPALESFPKSQLFTWGGQSTGVSALASFLPKNTRTNLL